MMLMKHHHASTVILIVLSLLHACGCITNDGQSDATKQLISDSEPAAATTNSNVDGSGKQPDKRDAEPGKPTTNGQRSDPSGLHAQQPVPVQYRAVYTSYPFAKLYASAAAPQVYYVKNPSSQPLHTSIDGPVRLAYAGPDPPQYLEAGPQRYQLVYSPSQPQAQPPSQYQQPQHQPQHQPTPVQSQQTPQYPSFIYTNPPQPQHLQQSPPSPQPYTIPAGVHQHQLAYSPYTNTVSTPNQHSPSSPSSPSTGEPHSPAPTAIIRYLQSQQYETQEKPPSYQTYYQQQQQPQYASPPQQQQLGQQHQQPIHIQLPQQQPQPSVGPPQGQLHGRTVQIQSIAASRPPVAYYTTGSSHQPSSQPHPYFAISSYPNVQQQPQPGGQTLVGIPPTYAAAPSSITLSKQQQFKTFAAPPPVASSAAASAPPGGQDGSGTSASHQGATSFATFTQQLSQQITPGAVAFAKQQQQQQQPQSAVLAQSHHPSQPYTVAGGSAAGGPVLHHPEKSFVPQTHPQAVAYGGQTLVAAASSPPMYTVLDAGPDGAGAIHYGTRYFHPSVGRYSYGPVNPTNQRLVFA